LSYIKIWIDFINNFQLFPQNDGVFTDMRFQIRTGDISKTNPFGNIRDTGIEKNQILIVNIIYTLKIRSIVNRPA
jgi:hypothetical protein